MVTHLTSFPRSGLLKGGKVLFVKRLARTLSLIEVADRFTFSPCLNRHLPRTRDHIGKGLHFRNDRSWRKAAVHRKKEHLSSLLIMNE
jgi:hypothetical protein